MQLTPLVLLAAEETHQEAGVPPIWVGVGVFVGLILLLLVVLAFGKGRPHA